MGLGSVGMQPAMVPPKKVSTDAGAANTESASEAPKNAASQHSSASTASTPVPATVPGNPEATAASAGVITVPTFAGLQKGTCTAEDRTQVMEDFFSSRGGLMSRMQSITDEVRKTDPNASGRIEVTLNGVTGEVVVSGDGGNAFPLTDQQKASIELCVRREYKGLQMVTTDGQPTFSEDQASFQKTFIN